VSDGLSRRAVIGLPKLGRHLAGPGCRVDIDPQSLIGMARTRFFSRSSRVLAATTFVRPRGERFDCPCPLKVLRRWAAGSVIGASWSWLANVSAGTGVVDGVPFAVEKGD
jgi:hypothetical protein